MKRPQKRILQVDKCLAPDRSLDTKTALGLAPHSTVAAPAKADIALLL